MSSIIAFHGSDHKVGTTQIAQCCAEYLALNYPDTDVLFVSASGGRGSEYCGRVSESLDRIRPYIAREMMSAEDAKLKFRYRDNLYMVGGTENPEMSECFTPDLAERFLNSMCQQFDLIIVDSGSQIDEGCCLGSVCAADRVYMMIKQCESSLRRYEWLSFLYDKLELKIDKYVVNFFERRSLYDLDYIAERLMISPELLMTVRNCELGGRAEYERKSILEMKAPKYFIKDIEILAKDIALYAGI